MPPGYLSSEEDDFLAGLQYSDNMSSGLLGCAHTPCKWVPNEELLPPLVEAFARACSQVPPLKLATLRTRIPVPLPYKSGLHCVESNWGIWFAAPGAPFPACIRRILLSEKTWDSGDCCSTQNTGCRRNKSAVYLEVLDGRGMERS